MENFEKSDSDIAALFLLASSDELGSTQMKKPAERRAISLILLSKLGCGDRI
jgi:hypothetical protein